MSILKAENLVRRLAGEIPVTLVDDISLEIQESEFVCIMGPSGSGKSSLLYLLGLLDVASSGRLWLDNENVSRLNEDQLANRRLEKLGFVFLVPFFTGRIYRVSQCHATDAPLGTIKRSQDQSTRNGFI